MIRAATVLAIALASSAAHAQSVADRAAFSVERFTPSPGGGGFLAADGVAVLPGGSYRLSVSGSLMSRPLVLNDLISGERVSQPVRVRLGYELAAAAGLGRGVELGMAAPVIAAQDGDRLQGIDLDERSLAPIAMGDLRFHGKVRLTPPAGGFGLAVAATASLPTGDNDHFAGEAGPVFGFAVITGYRHRRFRVAGAVGPRLRTERVVLLSPARPHGGELVASIAGEAPVPRSTGVSAVVEYAAVRGDAAASGTTVRGPSPHEFRLGGKVRRAGGWTFTAGVGFGTTPAEVGSPAWRVVVGAAFRGGDLPAP